MTLLRIHFAPDDLARVRIAPSPDPLAETILSLPVLQTDRLGGAALAGWRERTRRSLRPGMRPLLDLAPAGAGEYVPEAFTHATTATLAGSLDHTWSLPRRQWAADFHATERLRPRVPRWIHELHRGERKWSNLLHRTLHDYHAVAVAPYWAQLLAAAHTDRTQRALTAADAGVGALLATLHPEIRWASPVLSVPCDTTADVWLEGRGLLLVPTFFWPKPLALLDNAEPERPLVLRYPLARDLATYRSVWAAAAPAGPDGALASLVGTTRARVLQAVATPASTTELARRTHTSPATASHHTTVLRTAGLLTTERDGTGVRHALTPMGRALLHGTGMSPPAS
ncbi:ArsR/SmtB family transcription factor [Streptomyces netropsis]|uniref:DNA-binding transcriptional ArsR family regulator n=1 Tax=Streptomyces netropsis TaxID=55404 RepID=A0A7W7LD64_STRNE|nr:helix-turn-helix domain-containing protein [Streptomyces netropsis]MBB4888040.1 DNA-binding transcriptional ArsR family regulator [Streptomyces netropsis]